MKLLHAPRSPFAFKARIVVHELSLSDRVAFLAVDPWTDEGLRAANPLCKVPSLILESGERLYDSPVICEYLDHLVGGRLHPQGAERWKALQRQALGDGLAEAVIRRHVEIIAPQTSRSESVIRRQEQAILASLRELESQVVPAWELTPTIGEIAVGAALTYLTFRSPEIDWQRQHKSLANWFTFFSARASVMAAEFAGPPTVIR